LDLRRNSRVLCVKKNAQIEGSGELLREVLVVLLLLGVETNVLEEKGLAVLEVVDSLGGLVADAVLGDLHLLAEELRQALGAGTEGELVLRTTLGAAEMGGDPNAGTVVEEVLDGRDGRADPGVVGDGLAVQGNVQIAADEHLRCEKKLEKREQARLLSKTYSISRHLLALEISLLQVAD
jgi:hypothetical protein